MSHELAGIPEIRYDDLVAEARAKIPALAPAWTDHGPADTGVALLELLAWVTEILGYRATRETEAMTRAFLELLGGAAAAESADVTAAMRTTLEALWTRYRAATVDDYVHLALTEFPKTAAARALGAVGELHRVVCLAERDLDAPIKRAEAPGHVSLVVLRRGSLELPPALKQALLDFFEPRRLLATRVHVAAVTRVFVPVEVDAYLDEGASPAAIHRRIWDGMRDYFSPEIGGPDGDGLAIGGEVFLSDLYAILDAIDGIDFIARVALVVDHDARRIKNGRGETVGLAIYPHELAVYGTGRVKIRLFEPLSAGGWREVSQ